MIKVFENTADARIAGDWLRALCLGDVSAEARLARAKEPITKAQSEGVNIAGGFLVPTPMMTAIVRLLETRGVFRANARVIPMTSDSASRPLMHGA